MVNLYIKRYFISALTRKMQINVTVRYHFLVTSPVLNKRQLLWVVFSFLMVSSGELTFFLFSVWWYFDIVYLTMPSYPLSLTSRNLQRDQQQMDPNFLYSQLSQCLILTVVGISVFICGEEMEASAGRPRPHCQALLDLLSPGRREVGNEYSDSKR